MAEHKMDKSSLELGELPSNSMKSKQAAEKGDDSKKKEHKEVKSVVKGGVKVKKKPASKRFLESIGVEDGRTVGDYILWDVVLPSVKEMLASVVKNGIDVFLYGQTKPRNLERRGRTSRVSYNRYYDDDGYGSRPRGGRQSRGYSYQPRAAMDFSDIVFEDYYDEDEKRMISGREAAERVLDEMADIVQRYDFVRVSEFLTLANVPETDISHVDHNMGWDRLVGIGVDRVRGGYVIRLPRPIPFD